MWIPLIFYLAIVVMALVRPFWGLVGLIASMLIRFQDRYETIASIPTFQIIVLALILGMIIHRDKISSPKLKLDKLIAFFAFWVFMGLLLMDRSQLVEQMTQLLSSILVYYFVTRIVASRKDLETLLVGVVLVTAGLATEALMSFYADVESPFSNPITGRLQGLGYYANANEFGKLMCTAIPFAAIFLFRRMLLVRLAAVASIVIMVVVIGETLSRTCFVTLVIVIGASVMLRGSGKIVRKALLAGVASILILVSLSYLPGPLQERAASILQYSSDTSFQGRVRAWDQGFQMVSWYPVFGVGMGQWTEYHGRAPHNSYVQVMAETGIPGFIAFIAIFWVSFKRVITPLKGDFKTSSSELRFAALAIASSYCGYLFYILLGNQGYSPWTYFYFGLAGATYYLFKSQAEDGSGEPLDDAKTHVGARQ